MSDYEPRIPIPKLTLTAPVVPVYCGCHERKGHYLWTPGMRQLSYEDKNRQGLYCLDGKFSPQDTLEEGKAWMHWGFTNGMKYTVLSFWDYSIDQRPQSTSAFLIPEKGLSFAEALPEAKRLFPEVFARFTYEVKLLRNIL